MGYPRLRKEISGSNAVRSSVAAVSMNHTLEPLDQKISKYIGGNPVRIDGSPKASGILETVSSTVVQLRCSLSRFWLQIRAATANGVRVPKEFLDPAVMDPIVR